MNTHSDPRLIGPSAGWSFAYTAPTDRDGDPALLPAAHPRIAMPVPGFWDDHRDRILAASDSHLVNPEHRPIHFPMTGEAPDATLPHLVGVGEYEASFDAPPEGRLVFECGPVFLEAWLWVNGRRVAHQPHYSTGWSVPLDGFVVPGQPNRVTLQVANDQPRTKGCVTRGFKGYSAGIVGEARLRLTGPARVSDVYLQPVDRGESIRWHVEVDRLPDERPMELVWRLVDPDTGEAVRAGRHAASHGVNTWACDAAGLEPWSDRHPKLYHASLELRVGGDVSDTRSERFGLRVIEPRGMALRLNGTPLYLRGATEHAYFARTCTVPLDKQTHRRNILRFKELGFNWLRFHTWVPPEAYLDAADELGMLVQVEPPRGADDREWSDILRACRRHPSVVIYCAGNEELLDEDKLAQLERWAKLRRDLAPDALFNPQEALRGIEYGWRDEDLGDDAHTEPYRHNPRRLERVKSFSDCFGQYSWGWLSYKSAAGQPARIDERLAVYERPCLSHELGIHGTYLDLDLEHRYHGTRIGTDLYARVRAHLREHGLEHRASEYYANSCAWARRLRKHAVETARRCTRLTGYDLLGGIDYHWHRTGYPCGVMNEFYELKPGETADDVRRYNGPSVLLLEHDGRWSCAAGARWATTLSASIFEPQPVSAARVDWVLRDDDGRVYRSGGHDLTQLPHGAVGPVGDIAFDTPDLDRAAMLTLDVSLRGASIAIENRWPLWVYPPATFADGDVHWHDDLARHWAAPTHDGGANTDEPPLRVVPRLRAADVDALDRGGRVLLLGARPFPSKTTTYQISCAGRAEGNLATCIHQHPITNRLPHRGFCDLDFQSMLDRGEAVRVDSLPVPYDPIIEVVSSFKDVQKQASLFELRVGRGRLLVCTLGLSPDDPAAAHLLRCCIDYAGSDAFNPRHALPVSLLRELLEQDPRQETLGATDQGHDTRAALTPR